jgi:hypothetical protein
LIVELLAGGTIYFNKDAPVPDTRIKSALQLGRFVPENLHRLIESSNFSGFLRTVAGLT